MKYKKKPFVDLSKVEGTPLAECDTNGIDPMKIAFMYSFEGSKDLNKTPLPLEERFPDGVFSEPSNKAWKNTAAMNNPLVIGKFYSIFSLVEKKAKEYCFPDHFMEAFVEEAVLGLLRNVMGNLSKNYNPDSEMDSISEYASLFSKGNLKEANEVKKRMAKRLSDEIEIAVDDAFAYLEGWTAGLVSPIAKRNRNQISLVDIMLEPLAEKLREDERKDS